MPPAFVASHVAHGSRFTPRSPDEPLAANNTRAQTILEAWGQGFNVGALVILIFIVLCNYRRRVLLHKLVVLELVLALGHGFFIFFEDPLYGWVLSSTATPLYISYTIHNVIAWLKIKPFLPKWGDRLFIVSLIIVQPYWILEAWANFEYFNMLGNKIFEQSRFLEPLMRDPWWVFTTIKLVLVINKNYEMTFVDLIRTSPRFGVQLFCLLLSIIFLITDVVFTATTSKQSGINPFWRLALVFKCASDVIFLDDFKSVLDRIAESALRRFDNFHYLSAEGPASSPRFKPSSPRQKPTSKPFPSFSKNTSWRIEPKFGDRAGWTELRPEDRNNHHDGSEGGAQEDYNADTTSQQRASFNIHAGRDLGTTSLRGINRYGFQDGLLTGSDIHSAAPDYTWGSPTSQSTSGSQGKHDTQSNIPMRPLPARMKEKVG